MLLSSEMISASFTTYLCSLLISNEKSKQMQIDGKDRKGGDLFKHTTRYTHKRFVVMIIAWPFNCLE